MRIADYKKDFVTMQDVKILKEKWRNWRNGEKTFRRYNSIILISPLFLPFSR